MQDQESKHGGLSAHEIAERLGCSHTHVLNVERRALAKIRALLVEKYGEDVFTVLIEGER